MKRWRPQLPLYNGTITRATRRHHRLFSSDPLTFNSKQERLHELAEGDRLWLVSRSPSNQQYYFVGSLFVREKKRNSPRAVKGGSSASLQLSQTDPGALTSVRASQRKDCSGHLSLNPGEPVKHGASIGQSLQTLRFLSPNDDEALEAAFTANENVFPVRRIRHAAFGRNVTACLQITFSRTGQRRREPLAFLLYDPPPVLAVGAPVFIHSDKVIRLDRDVPRSPVCRRV